jgi:mannonate dehydratase
MTFTRRRFIKTVGTGAMAAAGLAAWRLWPEQGVLNPCLGPLPPALATHPLVREAWAGLDPAQVWDCHAHAFGVGDGGGDLAFDAGHSLAGRPFAVLQEAFFRNAACIEDSPPGRTDAALLARLHELVSAMPAGHKLLLLALDSWHDKAGVRHDERTHFRVGNDYCAELARRWPERFEWAASVHPYRLDAAAEIARVQRLGARALKWIPSAQGIDPASRRCDRAFEMLARLDLPLIVHCGKERAAPGDDNLGNPLRLRRALEHGVRIVVAHCASMGQDRDLDRGGGPWVESFALFERLMDEPAHLGRLFGDISALTQTARAGRPLRRVLERAHDASQYGADWAGRLLNGSDYPLPALMPLYSPRVLVDSGLLDAAAVDPLSAIRRHNPLLFDFVLKRHLRLGGRRLAKSVFATRRFFERVGNVTAN